MIKIYPLNTHTESSNLNDFSQIVIEFNCEESAAIGDIVRMSDSVGDLVVVCNDNRNLNKAIGIVLEKTSTTTAKILISGKYNYTINNLSKIGKSVFLGSDGIPTITVPTDGYIQCIGFVYDTNSLFINLSNDRVKRNPF